MEMIEMKFKLLSGRIGKMSNPVLFETGYETLRIQINYERLRGQIAVTPQTIRVKETFPG